ncbi:hypothetical protein M422DRAFT_155346, partial [Sphaerobolus stellatus SS14]
HWCLLVEVVEDISLLNPVYEVEDKDGHHTFIRFRVNPVHVCKFVSPNIKAGYTLCIMHAVRSRFLDGTIGIVVKEPGFVKVLPYKLRTILDVGIKARESKSKCPQCGKNAPLRCSRCSTISYCSPECQNKDWNSGNHKNECRIVQEFYELRGFDWDSLSHGRCH